MILLYGKTADHKFSKTIKHLRENPIKGLIFGLPPDEYMPDRDRTPEEHRENSIKRKAYYRQRIEFLVGVGLVTASGIVGGVKAVEIFCARSEGK